MNMRHAGYCVVIREIARGAARATPRMLDPIVALYRSDRSDGNVELLLDETSSGTADALVTRVEPAERKPLVAVIHWEEDQLPSVASEIFGNQKAEEETAVCAEYRAILKNPNLFIPKA